MISSSLPTAVESSLADTALANIAGEAHEWRGRFRPCPHCGRVLGRSRRRTIDRVVSIFHPVYRYRCHATSCAWEGNLPSVSVINKKIVI